jgi:hypothetical protein
MPEDKKRILELLSAGQINVEQAESLLNALGTAPGTPADAYRPGDSRRKARSLQIQIDSTGKNGDAGKNVSINVPIGLARFASRFLPQDARVQLDEQGVNLTELIESLSEDLPDGPLVEIDAGEGENAARITIRAV